jgi:hypothetical protein
MGAMGNPVETAPLFGISHEGLISCGFLIVFPTEKARNISNTKERAQADCSDILFDGGSRCGGYNKFMGNRDYF